MLFAVISGLEAQQTVGVFVNDPRAYPGYTLFAPSASQKTYLIDNCGRRIHQWTSNYTPGQSAYLLPDGNLLRSAKISSTFSGGGSGGRLEKISWDNTLTWAYTYSSADYHQHHDIKPLPNGNILILAWERVSQQDAIAAGRNPNSVSAQGLWPEHLVEINPMDSNDALIVWEWHAWDHLIQNIDSSKQNYGNIGEHPERIDLNFATSMGIGVTADWLHCNSIDYNPHLDQILISVHNFNEVWIIDHSTTSAEAAGHSGGNSGRGGDILYRWGNPRAYQRGTIVDQVFYGQHNARWVDEGNPGMGQISVFNNNREGVQGVFSSVDFFLPPIDSMGNYLTPLFEAFGPTMSSWSYDGLPDHAFHSNRVSSAQRLRNGNTLICSGNQGKFIEVNSDGEIVWEYVSPVSANNEVSQGSNPALNDIFHVIRYDIDYDGFEGRDLTPGDPLEKNPLPLMCDTLSSLEQDQFLFDVQISPNPFSREVTVFNPEVRLFCLDIFAGGQLIHRVTDFTQEHIEFQTDTWPSGLLLFVCTDAATMRTQVLKLIKL